MHLARFNPIRFAHLPTPIEPLPRLTSALAASPGGGPDIWIKRDDCTGLAGGGNKTRKLEFLLGDAMANGADTLVTQGAVQSNHVRQTAAAAARFGFACELILEERTGSKAVDYNRSGNVLLDELLDRIVHHPPHVWRVSPCSDGLRDRSARPEWGGPSPTWLGARRDRGVQAAPQSRSWPPARR